MSRKVRTSFAAPLVLTLAVAPACVVRTGTPPAQGGTAPSGGASTTQPDGTSPSTETGDTTTHTGVIIANPPPVVQPPPIAPTTPGEVPRMPQGTDTVQQTPPPTVQLTTWTVFQNKTSGQCYAAIDVQCNPKATCNPPPPRALDACPAGMTAGASLKIQEQAGGTCMLVFPTPASCGTNPACNPPRPRAVDCPT